MGKKKNKLKKTELIKLDNVSETSTDETGNLEWSSDIEDLLENIRLNCGVMSKYYKKRYMELKDLLKYYRIPLIILGSVNSVFAVGLVVYLPQKDVSVINCILSLICAVITSTELYLGISNSMEKALISQRDFYLLAVEIYTILSLEREHRSVNGKKYLDASLSQYNKFIENGDVIRKKIKDALVQIEDPSNPNQPDNNIESSKKNLTTIYNGESAV